LEQEDVFYFKDFNQVFSKKKKKIKLMYFGNLILKIQAKCEIK